MKLNLMCQGQNDGQKFYAYSEEEKVFIYMI